MTIKQLFARPIRSGLRRFGYDICTAAERRRDPVDDFRRLVGPRAVAFDVGANVGAFTQELHRRLPEPIIHAFEPSPTMFNALQLNCGALPNVYLNQYAVGSKPGIAQFNENSESTMSSFLELGSAGWGSIQRKWEVETVSLDSYCEARGIERIDLLKSDTQGFDFEVLKGAQSLFNRGAIRLVFIEVIFIDMYKNQAKFDEIISFLAKSRLFPIGIYNLYYRDDRIGWTDMLFERA